ncbi:hypothetical protein OAK75_13280 [Bacteriovoracales bacterium]|nr:hypothetical protein [Bacteriovoracales bacterium]
MNKYFLKRFFFVSIIFITLATLYHSYDFLVPIKFIKYEHGLEVTRESGPVRLKKLNQLNHAYMVQPVGLFNGEIIVYSDVPVKLIFLLEDDYDFKDWQVIAEDVSIRKKSEDKVLKLARRNFAEGSHRLSISSDSGFKTLFFKFKGNISGDLFYISSVSEMNKLIGPWSRIRWCLIYLFIILSITFFIMALKI